MSLVVDTVVLGASAGMKDVASQAVKDAYTGLKALLARRQVDVSGVEAKPESSIQRAALEETLSSGVVDDEVLAAARAVADAVAEHAPDAAGVVGVDLRRVKARFVEIRKVESAGTGVRGEDLDVAGGIVIGEVSAGGSDPSVR